MDPQLLARLTAAKAQVKLELQEEMTQSVNQRIDQLFETILSEVNAPCTACRTLAAAKHQEAPINLTKRAAASTSSQPAGLNRSQHSAFEIPNGASVNGNFGSQNAQPQSSSVKLGTVVQTIRNIATPPRQYTETNIQNNIQNRTNSQANFDENNCSSSINDLPSVPLELSTTNSGSSNLNTHSILPSTSANSIVPQSSTPNSQSVTNSAQPVPNASQKVIKPDPDEALWSTAPMDSTTTPKQYDTYQPPEESDCDCDDCNAIKDRIIEENEAVQNNRNNDWIQNQNVVPNGSNTPGEHSHQQSSLEHSPQFYLNHNDQSHNEVQPKRPSQEQQPEAQIIELIAPDNIKTEPETTSEMMTSKSTNSKVNKKESESHKTPDKSSKKSSKSISSSKRKSTDKKKESSSKKSSKREKKSSRSPSRKASRKRTRSRSRSRSPPRSRTRSRSRSIDGYGEKRNFSLITGRTDRFKTVFLSCLVSGCRKTAPNKGEIDEHLSIEHHIYPHRCPLKMCDATYMRKPDLMHHLRVGHPNITWWECFACPEKFISPHQLGMHLFFEHQEGRFECNYPGCNYWSKYRRTVYDHYMAHINLPSRSRSRSKSSNRSSNRFSERHEEITPRFKKTELVQNPNIKFEELAMKCLVENCIEFFFDREDMDVHLDRVHGLCHEMCAAYGCDKSFNSRSQLEDHVNANHSLITHWRCRKCPFTVDNFHAIDTHRYRCHQEGQFKCILCSKQGKYRIDILTHYETAHAIK